MSRKYEPQQVVILTGNPVEGFTVIGVFDSRDEAIEWAEDLDPDWWVAPLQAKEAA